MRGEGGGGGGLTRSGTITLKPLFLNSKKNIYILVEKKYRYVNTMSLEASSFDHHASLLSNICACRDTAASPCSTLFSPTVITVL